jgi:hypothetical protein
VLLLPLLLLLPPAAAAAAAAAAALLCTLRTVHAEAPVVEDVGPMFLTGEICVCVGVCT